MCRDPISGSFVERRKAARYRLRLPVTFHWRDGESCTETGLTSDVGAEGALIHSGMSPPLGSDVLVELLLPLPGRSNERLLIAATARVTRIVDDPSGCAFGVHGKFKDEQIDR